MKDITLGTFEGRLLLAFVLGACIGFERQWRHKLAGIKTNALVAGGSALFILLAEKITGDSSGVARVAAQIVTGIGFLGAGVILREGANVSGLSTSATVWCSGAIGALAGMGYWYEACVGGAFVILAHIILNPISERVDQRVIKIMNSGNKYLLRVHATPSAIGEIRTTIINLVQKTQTLHIATIQAVSDNELNITVNSLDKRQTDIDFVVNEIYKLNVVSEASWQDVK